MSPAAKESATGLRPGHAKSATTRSLRSVRQEACRRSAAQKRSKGDAWAADGSKNNTRRQIIADAGPPFLSTGW